MSAHTVNAIPSQTIKSIALVGNAVTFQGVQYICHSVEGYDYFAFVSATDRNTVTCDFGMPESYWLAEPRAYILPMGARMGEGSGLEVKAKDLVRGVSLAKV